MSRVRPDAEIRLWIDDTPSNVGAVQFLYQAEPRPGGHAYRFEIRGRDVLTISGEMHGDRHASLDRRIVQRTMMEVEILIAKLADVPRAVEYFINTIDAISETDEGLRIDGRCSPVVRTSLEV